MRFDVIIGNPPYQAIDIGVNESSASPIYHNFIEKAKDLNPNYISMIIPSKWMKGGKGLKEFRETMLDDKRIRELVDFHNSQKIFPSVGISGGICYFFWDSNHDDQLNFTHIDMNGDVDKSTRYLRNKFTNNVIRDSRQISIIEKVFNSTDTFFNEIVSSRNPFGLPTNFFNLHDKHKGIDIYDEYKEGLIKVHYVNNNKRYSKFIGNEVININRASVDKYKLLFSKAYNYNLTVPPKIILSPPRSASTDTFLKIGDFDSETEMKSCLSYMKTKFFRALLYYNRHSLSMSRTTFELIPIQNFDKTWTDKKLYEKYRLTENEIDYIERNIKEMN